MAVLTRWQSLKTAEQPGHLEVETTESWVTEIPPGYSDPRSVYLVAPVFIDTSQVFDHRGLRLVYWKVHGTLV